MQPGEHLVDFKHPVGGFTHTATTIRILSSSVAHFDIQAQPAHGTLLLRQGLRLRIERTKDSVLIPRRIGFGRGDAPA